MFFIKKKRFKPLYKKFIKARENVQHRKKLLGFKKKKWELLVKSYINKRLKWYKRFKPNNQHQYIVTKYPNRGTSLKKNCRDTLQSMKRFRLFYGDLRKKVIKNQIHKLIKKSFKNRNIAFIELFEKRLDTVLYRAKFCPSVRNSQQLITHGKVLVNNKETKTKSYILKPGDLVSVKSKCSAMIGKNIQQVQIWPIPPKHLLINYKTMQIIFGDTKHTNLYMLFAFNLNLEKMLNKFA